MATEKNINTRITLKHDKEENWLKATTFVPKAGELIVYDPDTTYNYTRIKIGDGSTKVSALPFLFDKPGITITNGTATTPTGDTVAVISGETASGHTITNTKVNVATKDYVDRKSVAAVQYLGTVSNATELAALNPNSVGDFCRVAAAFSSYHAGDLLLCKTLKTSSAAATWDVIHGEIDKDTWTANSKNAAGYVAAGGTNANKVWKTDASGNPAWRDDANTNTAHAHSVGTGLNIDGSGGISGTTKYSLKVASSSEIGGVKPGTTSGKTYGVAVASDGAMTVNVPWTDTNTDTKVTQTAVTASDYTNWRPLIIGSSNSNTEGFSPSNVTDGVYAVNTITCQPSSGTIRATTFKGNASTASKLTTARTIALSGDVSGSTTFDGSGNVTITTTASSAKKATQDGDGKTISSTYAKLSGATFSGDVIVNAPHRDTYYASNLCRNFSQNTPNQFVIKTKIKYVSSTNMPVIRIYGYAYGLQSPIELRVGFYIYDNHLGWAGVSCTGAWKPEVYLFSYTENSTKYVAVGFKGSCYFCGFQVDAQVGASGEFGPNFTIDGWKTTHNGADTSVNIIPSIGTDNCIKVDYKPMQTDINGTATKATQDGDGNVITSTYAKKSHKHSVTAAGTVSSTSITPAGTVSQPTFTGTAASHNHTFTGTAAEHTHTFTGTQATASVKYTPAGTVSQPTFTGTAHSHTFSGSSVNSGKPDTTNVTTIYSITGVGTLPSASLSSGTLPSCSYTAPSLSASVSNQCLTISLSGGSHSFSAGAFPTLTFSTGTLPTREAVSMPNTNHTHSVTAAGTVGSTTAGGTVSKPTFSGTEATISHTFTPAGSISKASLTPAGTISSKELTPAGTVSKPTFTGTAASHTHTFTGSAVNSATES